MTKDPRLINKFYRSDNFNVYSFFTPSHLLSLLKIERTSIALSANNDRYPTGITAGTIGYTGKVQNKKESSSLCGRVNKKVTSKYNSPYPTAHGGDNSLRYEEKYGLRLGLEHTTLCTLIENTDKPHFIKTSS